MERGKGCAQHKPCWVRPRDELIWGWNWNPLPLEEKAGWGGGGMEWRLEQVCFVAKIPASTLGATSTWPCWGWRWFLFFFSLGGALFTSVWEIYSSRGLSWSLHLHRPHFPGSALSGLLPVPAGLCLGEGLSLRPSSLSLDLVLPKRGSCLSAVEGGKWGTGTNPIHQVSKKSWDVEMGRICGLWASWADQWLLLPPLALDTQ